MLGTSPFLGALILNTKKCLGKELTVPSKCFFFFFFPALCVQSCCQSEFYYFQYPSFNCGQDSVTNNSLFCKNYVTMRLLLYYTVKYVTNPFSNCRQIAIFWTAS